MVFLLDFFNLFSFVILLVRYPHFRKEFIGLPHFWVSLNHVFNEDLINIMIDVIKIYSSKNALKL